MAYLLDEKGKFISQDHSRVAEMIKEYSHDLDLVWIPPEKRDHDEQFPFAILHSPEGKEPYIVRKVQMQDMNENLIAWCWMNDSSKNNRQLNSWLEAQEFAQKTLSQKRIEEAKEEQFDFIQTVLQGKNYFRHNGKVYS